MPHEHTCNFAERIPQQITAKGQFEHVSWPFAFPATAAHLTLEYSASLRSALPLAAIASR
ncbi:MAG: hypothetical protein EGQ84_06760 [Slackia sp.]|nr:hypothetical protein [Slackia sp.]